MARENVEHVEAFSSADSKGCSVNIYAIDVTVYCFEVSRTQYRRSELAKYVLTMQDTC